MLAAAARISIRFWRRDCSRWRSCRSGRRSRRRRASGSVAFAVAALAGVGRQRLSAELKKGGREELRFAACGLIGLSSARDEQALDSIGSGQARKTSALLR